MCTSQFHSYSFIHNVRHTKPTLLNKDHQRQKCRLKYLLNPCFGSSLIKWNTNKEHLSVRFVECSFNFPHSICAFDLFVSWLMFHLKCYVLGILYRVFFFKMSQGQHLATSRPRETKCWWHIRLAGSLLRMYELMTLKPSFKVIVMLTF